MKKIIIVTILILTSTSLVAGSQHEFVVGIGLFTKHLVNSERYNEGFFNKNQLIRFGIKRNDYILSYYTFENSMYNRSHMINIEKQFQILSSDFYFAPNVGIVKGYNRHGEKPFYFEKNGKEITGYRENSRFVFYKDYGAFPILSLNYTKKEFSLNVSLAGKCVITGLSVFF